MDFDEDYDLEKKKQFKATKVRSKLPAAVQITAEQLIREAKEKELEITLPAPEQRITDLAELKDYQLRKRKDYEDNIRRCRINPHNWIKYAAFEDSQGEIERARSVYERALDVDHRNVGLWLKYLEMEQRRKQVNHARNLFDRACKILPRASQFWFKYVYFEEKLGNPAGARQVFERWMKWEPDEEAWHAYINMELRHQEKDRARQIYDRFVTVHPEGKNWVKYAKFEERTGFIASARKVFETAMHFFGQDNPQPKLLLEFARFEERQKEHDRARFVYKWSLDNLPKENHDTFYKAYALHEKKFGDRVEIEDILFTRRKMHYEAQLEENSYDYDVWFDYLRLMEKECTAEDKRKQVEETYERAVACEPPLPQKCYWRRFIYIWIKYALYEELSHNDVSRAREVYKVALERIPHSKFTFAKVWLLAANLEIRQGDISAARKLLGNALGRCPKPKLYRSYIEVEIQLRQFDRVRRLYANWIAFDSADANVWIKYAELEVALSEIERARIILQLGREQPLMDMPELLWKASIDLEAEHGETERARELYKILLTKTQHAKVWISLAKFELTVDEDDGEACVDRARTIYQTANEKLRFKMRLEASEVSEIKQHRVLLLSEWLEFEKVFGSPEMVEEVSRYQPVKEMKQRRVDLDESDSTSLMNAWEEYIDYRFPEDDTAEASFLEKDIIGMSENWAKGIPPNADEDDVYSSSEDESSDTND